MRYFYHKLLTLLLVPFKKEEVGLNLALVLLVCVEKQFSGV